LIDLKERRQKNNLPSISHNQADENNEDVGDGAGEVGHRLIIPKCK